MQSINCFEFPATDELAGWEPTVRVRTLARRVLAVARTRIEGKWAAYCDAVPGKNHDYEFQDVLDQGVKLPEPWARALFPEFDGIPYAN